MPNTEVIDVLHHDHGRVGGPGWSFRHRARNHRVLHQSEPFAGTRWHAIRAAVRYAAGISGERMPIDVRVLDAAGDLDHILTVE